MRTNVFLVVLMASASLAAPVPSFQGDDHSILEPRVWPFGGRTKTKVPDLEMGNVNHQNAPRPSSGSAHPTVGTTHPAPPANGGAKPPPAAAAGGSRPPSPAAGGSRPPAPAAGGSRPPSPPGGAHPPTPPLPAKGKDKKEEENGAAKPPAGPAHPPPASPAGPSSGGGAHPPPPPPSKGKEKEKVSPPASPTAPSSPRPATPKDEAPEKCNTCGHTEVEAKKLEYEQKKLDIEKAKQDDLNANNAVVNAQADKSNKENRINGMCRVAGILCAGAIVGAVRLHKARDVDAEGWQMPAPYRKIAQRAYIDATYFPNRL